MAKTYYCAMKTCLEMLASDSQKDVLITHALRIDSTTEQVVVAARTLARNLRDFANDITSGCHASIPTHYNTMHDVGELYTRLKSEIDTLSAMLFLVGGQPLVETFSKACV